MSFPDNTSQYETYYADLLPAQYKTKPKARATIKTLADLAIMPQGGNYLLDQNYNALTDKNGNYLTDKQIEPILPLAVAGAFNVATAKGEQLRFLAELVGCSDSGVNLLGHFITLSDSDFSLLIQAKGAYNRLRATTQGIQSFINQYFSGILRVSDDFNMHMTYTYLVALGSIPWVELFITQGFLPRPLGVNYGSLLIPGDYFGLCTYWAPPMAWSAPACTYTAPVSSSTPLLTYSSVIEV